MKHFLNNAEKVAGYEQTLGMSLADAEDADILDQLAEFMLKSGDTRTAVIAIIELLLNRIRRRTIKAHFKIGEN